MTQEPKHSPEYKETFQMCPHCLRVVEKSQAEVNRSALFEEMVEALGKLTNEVGGLAAFEEEIRMATGNTNWQCLQDRRMVCEEILRRARGETK